MESLSINSPKNDDLDPRGSINSLDDTHRQEGIAAGYEDGLTLISGKENGNQVGLKLGFEVGAELRYYQGCLHVWNSAMKIEPTIFSSRFQNNIKEMDELIKTYPVYDPENKKVQEFLNALRLKFKVISPTLFKKLERRNNLDF
ncbi:hypothetical protein MKX01_039293 [Papaver californicum]|nr:hypothetical protein MKX01_039293 [Papaver californicum]